MIALRLDRQHRSELKKLVSVKSHLGHNKIPPLLGLLAAIYQYTTQGGIMYVHIHFNKN